LIKIDKTERFTTALEAEPQGYRHFLKSIVLRVSTYNALTCSLLGQQSLEE